MNEYRTTTIWSITNTNRDITPLKAIPKSYFSGVLYASAEVKNTSWACSVASFSQ
jgi:hypothetical protein